MLVSEALKGAAQQLDLDARENFTGGERGAMLKAAEIIRHQARAVSAAEIHQEATLFLAGKLVS